MTEGDGKIGGLGMNGGTHRVGNEVTYRRLACADWMERLVFREKIKETVTCMDEGGWDDNECLLGPSSRLELSSSSILLPREFLRPDSSSIFNRLKTSAAESWPFCIAEMGGKA